MTDAERFAPLPPLDSEVYSAATEWAFFGVQSAVALIAIGFAVAIARRHRTWIPLVCMLGGALTLIIEPVIDDHLQVWWPAHHEPDVYTAYGRDLPIVLIPILIWYFGGGSMLRWHWLQQRGAEARLWTVYAIEVGAALALEPPAIQLDIWHYYGEHGLRIFGYPIWWPFVGGACAMAAGTLVYLMTPYLQGWRVLIAAVLIPMAVAAGYWACSWPMFNVLNTEPSDVLVYTMPFVSIGLALTLVWLCTVATGHDAHRRATRLSRRRERVPVAAGS